MLDKEKEPEIHGPVLEFDVGRVEGLTVNIGDRIAMDVFYGIPFAEAPIGENRFEVKRRENEITALKFRKQCR
jgi:carboxylesterase type B